MQQGEGLYLYQGSTSVCSIKVRLVLAEKDLPWRGEVLDLQAGDQHRPAYLALNPNGVVPTLVHDGHVLLESTLIMEYLDEAFPAPPLMPADAFLRARARLWMKRIDDVLHAACSTITFATANRRVLLRKSPAELQAHFARIPDAAYRERQRLSVEQGLAAPHVADALRHYDRYIGDMERALGEGAWLAGADYSLADAAATPYLNRARMLGMEALWSARPRVADWLARVGARTSFDRAVTQALSAADHERFTVPREESEQVLRQVLGG